MVLPGRWEGMRTWVEAISFDKVEKKLIYGSLENLDFDQPGVFLPLSTLDSHGIEIIRSLISRSAEVFSIGVDLN
jgi:hypothetical protein